MCHFIANYGDKKDINDSRTWGNYSDSTGEAETASGSKQVSGYNDAWKANNLYDTAGNVWDWTMEANYTTYRINRGGDYSYNGSSYPASYRGGTFSPGSIRTNFGSRPTLMINP